VQVIRPYTRLHPEVTTALSSTGQWEDWNVGYADDAYWHLFASLWARGETFCVVEHDVIVRDMALDELASCESDWCSFLVPYVGLEYAGLACAKFTEALIARVPDALQAVAANPGDEDHPPKHWCRLDAWLQAALEEAGERKCIHGPPLQHLRDPSDEKIRPSHGCWH
jgi:hypothetical protein